MTTLEPHSRIEKPQRRALTATEVVKRLASLDDWRLCGDGDRVAIEKTYTFANYYETLSFVNAVAYIVHRQDHHPELLITYSRCVVRFNTHDVGGISESDFECAALVDGLRP